MDINIISDIINTFGFPAVMVGYFIYDRYKTVIPMIKAVNNNTAVIDKLSDKLFDFLNDMEFVDSKYMDGVLNTMDKISDKLDKSDKSDKDINNV